MSTISLNPKSATPQGQPKVVADAATGPAASDSPFHGLSGLVVDLGMGSSDKGFELNRAAYSSDNFCDDHARTRIGDSVVSGEAIRGGYSTAA